jgi:dihydroflavonol-4-reductase
MMNYISGNNISSPPTTVLVTGANGQLGRRLLPRLAEAGYTVRAHYRNAERARKYCPSGTAHVLGDLTDPSWFDQAVAGCEIVIHGAARVSLRPGKHDEQYRINVDGTRHIIDACRRNGVRRLIYVSSVAAVGASDDGRPLDETARFNLDGYNIPYAETKHEAETLALAANSGDLEVVVVNPSIMISPPDRPVTERDLRKIPRFIPAYFEFGINVVETEDVIKGIISAIERGRPGERYLLTGENLDPDRAFELASKYFGIRKPKVRLPVTFLYPIATIFELFAKIKGKRPKFHRGLARLARLKFIYTSNKARRELGFSPRPLEETIEDILSGIARFQNK